jgi:hypothetical protein
MLQTKEEIEQWLDELNIPSYSYEINDDLTIDAFEPINISHKELKTIPVQFNKVYGGFYCRDNQLSSLLGVPFYVYGSFSCQNNPLINHSYLPYHVTEFECSGVIDLRHLMNMKLERRFMHFCHTKNEQIQELEHLYTHPNHAYFLDIRCEAFNQLIDTVKEKHFLEHSMEEVIKDSYKHKTKI